MKTVIKMAREAGLCTWLKPPEDVVEKWEAFAALVCEDEAEKYKWDVHSCGPTCTKIGCVALREAVKAEREQCAKVCENLPMQQEYDVRDQCSKAIRARGQA